VLRIGDLTVLSTKLIVDLKNRPWQHEYHLCAEIGI